MKWRLIVLMMAVILLMSIAVLPQVASAAGPWDQYGYNDTARIFVGTGSSWCQAGGLSQDWCNSYLGASANDSMVMKWNAEWDRGNAENWSNPPYAAWTDNEWNGMYPGGDGSVWHYKIAWVGPCTDGNTFDYGGYCIWGQFAVLMDQGTVKQDGHYMMALASPNGYGARR